MTARLDDLATSFRRDLRAEGRSERTAVVYGQSIRFFSAWLVAQGRTATLDELERAAIRAWLAELADRFEPGTVRTRYKGLRRFCRWLHVEGEVEVDPMANMEVPKVVDKPVPTITDEDLAKIIKACAGRGFEGRRDEAIVRFLLDTGCRVSELCGITLDDLDLDRETARVLGKGSKRRSVYFAPRPRDRSTGTSASARRTRKRTPPWCSCPSVARTPPMAYGTCSAGSAPGRRRRAAPAPVPAHVRSRLPARRWAGPGPETAGRVVERRHAGAVRVQRRRRAGTRGRQADATG